jgi:DNA modification methylase
MSSKNFYQNKERCQMRFEKVDINKLAYANYNPRKDLQPKDAEYKKLKKSIEEFGYVEPIIVNQNNTVIGGHQRAKILQDLGFEKIDIVRVNIPKEKEKALNIALNKISGEWDFEKLTNLLKDIKINNENDFLLTGFDEKEFDKLRNEFDDEFKTDKSENENFDLEKAKQEIVSPVSKPSDMYQLGEHILMCGNSFEQSQIDKLIGNNSIDMVFTDPPYNMKWGGAGCFAESTKKIKKRIDKLIEFDVNKIQHMKNLKAGSFYICTSKDGIKDYLRIFDDFHFNILIWGKTNAIPMTHNQFIPDVEYIMYFYNSNRIWNNSLKPTEIYKKYYISSIQKAKKQDGDLHPTMKPIELISNRIKISSKKNGIVLDLFGGSGSTLIASEMLNRKCLMMEIEPTYCDVIIKRYIDFKEGNKEDIFLLENGNKIQWDKIDGYKPKRSG